MCRWYNTWNNNDNAFHNNSNIVVARAAESRVGPRVLKKGFQAPPYPSTAAQQGGLYREGGAQLWREVQAQATKQDPPGSVASMGGRGGMQNHRHLSATGEAQTLALGAGLGGRAGLMPAESKAAQARWLRSHSKWATWRQCWAAGRRGPEMGPEEEEWGPERIRAWAAAEIAPASL